MAKSIYAQIIEQLRKETGMNQGDVARLLEVSQGTVSRIEKSNLTPGTALAEKIKKLPIKEKGKIKLPLTEKFDLNKLTQNKVYKQFDISFFSLPLQKESGDLCLIKRVTSEQTLVYLVDCVGHGKRAGKMAFAMRFGLEVALNSLSTSVVGNQSINSALLGALDATHDAWDGPPATITAMLNSRDGVVKVMNSLQPTPLLFANNSLEELSPTNINIGSKHKGRSITLEEPQTTLQQGDALLLCTDGFVDLFGDYSQMKERFFKSAKAFKGDSKAILLNLASGAEGVDKGGFMAGENLKDDTTVMVITA